MSTLVMDYIERRESLRAVLRACGWDLCAAARALGCGTQPADVLELIHGVHLWAEYEAARPRSSPCE